MTRTFAALAVMVLHLHPSSSSAAPVASRYELSADGGVTRTTEVAVASPTQTELKHVLDKGSDPSAARVTDAATGQALAASVVGGTIIIRLGPPPGEGGTRRVNIEERFAAGALVRRSSDGLVLESPLPGGRHTVVLPPGHALRSASPAVQVQVRDGRVHAGLVVPDDARWALRLETAHALAGPSEALTRGVFRSEDARGLVYYLEDPTAHRIDITIDVEIDRPGQAHVYSQLRKEDNITNAKTLDLDRGQMLPTRIITGTQANAIGDAGTTFPDDASVFVADLPEPVQAGGRRRVRLFQTAIDATSYGLDAQGYLRFDRFVARLRTVTVLPAGWVLTSVDQPAVLSRDSRGRVVLDFLETGGEVPRMLLTARRATP